MPDRWPDDERDCVPLPRTYAAAEREPKLLVVHQPLQVFGAYERGTLVRWGPISSGRRSAETPPGLFHLTWRSRGRYSTVDPSWYLRWYYNFDNAGGQSFHEYVLPGIPASHSCVRLLARDAEWLYAWGDEWLLDRGQLARTGTPVLIVGRYDFDRPPPWQAPATRPDVVALPDRADW